MKLALCTTAVLCWLSFSHGFTSQPFQRRHDGVGLCQSVSKDSIPEINRSFVRKAIDNLSTDNFSSTLEEIEPFLVGTAGLTFYSKSMRRIKRAAKFLSLDIPKDYAKEAAATSKQRERQAAYIQSKLEEAKTGDEAAASDEGEGDDATENSADT